VEGGQLIQGARSLEKNEVHKFNLKTGLREGGGSQGGICRSGDLIQNDGLTLAVLCQEGEIVRKKRLLLLSYWRVGVREIKFNQKKIRKSQASRPGS